MVWDGLRPDSIRADVTPNLAELRDRRGTNFRNHHSVYPCMTMINAAAFATGARSSEHGFYGNYEYEPGPKGNNARGAQVDYDQPFFTEDHAILQNLDAYYRRADTALLRVPTLFQAAREQGLATATLGKAGPAFLQDYRLEGDRGVILDENVVLPRAFGLALQRAGFALPRNATHYAYSDGPLALAADNGDPTAPTPPVLVTLDDGVTADPRAARGSPHKQRNAYFVRVFLDYVMPKLDPALSVLWLRNPDSTEHSYGPGTPSVRDALRHQDHLLGELLQALTARDRVRNTDLLVVSDHGHSTVASSAKLFPLRDLDGPPDGRARVGAMSDHGYVVSGEVRSAEWLRRAGFDHVYDGMGCVFDPVLSGLGPDGKSLHPEHADPRCTNRPVVSTPEHRVPAGKLAQDAIVIAPSGGSEYAYVPSHDRNVVRRLVKALQERAPFGPVFVRSLYGAIPGTLPLTRIGLEPEQPQPTDLRSPPPMPDVVYSFAWDDRAVSAAAPDTPGTEHSSPHGNRGMHGSFSPIDVHNVLIATGPSFRAGFADDLPSSNLDVAPTIATLLGLHLPRAQGRTLHEALALTHAEAPAYEVEPFEERAGPVSLRRLCRENDPDCRRPLRNASYTFTLYGQALVAPDGSRRFTYYDRALATRTVTSPHRGGAQVSGPSLRGE